MAFYWVFQNKTYSDESQGNYLWAPLANKDGDTVFHWEKMDEVRPGDVIFSCVDKHIVAVSVAESEAVACPRPSEFKLHAWETNGRRVNAKYTAIDRPLSVSSVKDELKTLMPEKYGPLNRKGTGNQGYLFSLPPQAGHFLLRAIGAPSEPATPDVVLMSIEAANIPTTERQALVLSRIGQGRFRDSLMRYWEGKCCVTGLAIPELLRASHIKPWRDSNNAERLDPNNGLLLSPSYDAAFDEGYITFREDGRIGVCSRLTSEDVTRLGINSAASIDRLDNRHKPYLSYHASEVFKG